MQTGSQTLYYHTNRQFSTVALTDTAGQVTERYAYSPYGDVKFFTANGQSQPTSSIGNPYLYTGRENDSETSLWYFRARMYHSKLGRFMNHDPLMYPDGANTYAGWFVPNATDPSGTNPAVIVIGGITIAVTEAEAIASGLGMSLSQCLLSPSCRDALEKAVRDVADDLADAIEEAKEYAKSIWRFCKKLKIKCRMSIDPQDHSFTQQSLIPPFFKTCWQSHVQVNCYIEGIKGSGSRFRRPFRPCCKFKHCKGGITH